MQAKIKAGIQARIKTAMQKDGTKKAILDVILVCPEAAAGGLEVNGLSGDMADIVVVVLFSC